MIRVRTGRVVRTWREGEAVTRLTVECDGETAQAVNYDNLTGPVYPGDEVLLNTTAVHLGLGTGGAHFVMGVAGASTEPELTGHIMKCRYTPAQVAVQAVEEQSSPHHQALQDGDLGAAPVLALSLHSLVAAAAVVAKRVGGNALRVVYVMTDGAALPAPFSRLVRQLRSGGYLDAVVTCGHAFGGDIEAVTLHSGLLAAKRVCRADLVIVAMGPGVVGTGTVWGTTAIEQGSIVDAAAVLGGRPIAVPRLSFADPRPRHRGLSHHALTALGRVAARRCEVALPTLDGEQAEWVGEQLLKSDIAAKHIVRHYDGWFVVDALERGGIDVTTMGRTPAQDPAPFAAAAAGALCALDEAP